MPIEFAGAVACEAVECVECLGDCVLTSALVSSPSVPVPVSVVDVGGGGEVAVSVVDVVRTADKPGVEPEDAICGYRRGTRSV